MFPKEVTVRLVWRIATSMVGGTLEGAAHTGIGGTFFLNALPQGVPLTAGQTRPRGSSDLIGAIPTGGNKDWINSSNTVTTGTIEYTATGWDIPVAYYHLGNIYQRYRVNKFKHSVAIKPVTSQVSSTSASVAHPVVLTQFATADTAAGTPTFIRDWTQWRSESFVRQKKALMSIYQPTTLYSSFSMAPIRLIRDKTWRTSLNYIGSCTPGVSGAPPTYSYPPNCNNSATPNIGLWYGFVLESEDATSMASSGYNAEFQMTHEITYIVKFFEPHQNNDFNVPI